jgi:hypothetical protein
MMKLVESIITKQYDNANQELAEAFRNIMEKKMSEMKKQLAAKMCEEETEQLDEAPRVAIVKARIRGGKIQRRKRVSNVAGFTMRAGKLTRMSASERRKRKLGARKAARKSRTKRNQMLRKRRMSLMKRSRLGL